jgi:hypothetical protein
MKDFNLTEVFCEVLSGLGLIFAAIPAFDLLGIYSLKDVLAFLSAHASATLLATTLAAAYIIGLVVDALGLTIGELFLDKCINKDAPKPAENSGFWKGAQEHVFRYRDVQWAYYSCYRNLFCLFVPAGVLWTILAALRLSKLYVAAVVISFLICELAFLWSMKALLKIYYQITKTEYPVGAGPQ